MSIYNIEINSYYKNNKVIIFRWSAEGIGFGELIIDATTHEIIDDEYMSKDFCDEVISKGFSKIREEIKMEY